MFYLNRTYDLEFSGALAGLEIKIKNTSVATLLQLEETAINSQEMADLLAGNVVEWNWGSGQGAEPIVAESFLALESPVLRAIVNAWHKAATGVSAPLDQPSKDGDSLVEESIPMEAL
jgi:hypothetical protein